MNDFHKSTTNCSVFFNWKRNLTDITLLKLYVHVSKHNAITRAVTVLDFSLPRWSSNKYRGLAVNCMTSPPPVKNWRGATCASAWSVSPKRLRAAEPQHIVAGVRFHWSREEMLFQRERFVGRATLTASARARRCTRTERNGGFGFQTKIKDCLLNQRRWQIILMKKNGLNVEHFRYHIAIN